MTKLDTVVQVLLAALWELDQADTGCGCCSEDDSLKIARRKAGTIFDEFNYKGPDDPDGGQSLEKV